MHYRCSACTTRTQPHGKTNKISQLTYKSTTYLLQQHITSDSHIAKVKAKTSQAEGVQPEKPKLKCHGLYIGLTQPSGPVPSILRNYWEEVRLWVTHTKLKDLTCNSKDRHEYKVDMSAEALVVRARGCLQEYSQPDDGSAATCCPECWNLTEPRRLQRTVVRFTLKYNAAKLLEKRLFFPEAEVQSFLQDVQGSFFGQNNSELWKTITDLANANLQVWVRRAFMSHNNNEIGANLGSFMSSIVEPCLKVHVGSVKSNVVALSSRFLDALTENKQSEP